MKRPPRSRVATALCATLFAAGAASQAGAARVQTLLAELDERFERGDVRGYLAKFDPDNYGAVAMMGRRLERQIAASRSRERTSSVLAGPTRIGAREVLLLRHDVELVQPDGRRRSLVEESYLALRADGEQLTPTFSVETVPELQSEPSDKLHCSACNCQIGGVDGFLYVPLRRERALALESASFYLIGTDVVCDVHVQVQNRPQQARAAARRLAEAFAELAPDAEPGMVTDWRPPAYANKPPEGMDSAQVIVKLQNERQISARAAFRVITLGGLQHVLLTRGSEAALRAAATPLSAFYGSYALIQQDRDVAGASAQSIRHHLGGSFEGARYANARYGVTFSGPAGWRPEHRVGGARFRVRWSAPDSSQLWLNGYGVPTGMESWTRRDADNWIAHRCRARDLYPVAAQPVGFAATWRERPDGALERSVLLELRVDPSSSEKPSPSRPRRRALHVQLHGDLLLIVDAYGASQQSEEAAVAAFSSLRRKP